MKYDFGYFRSIEIRSSAAIGYFYHYFRRCVSIKNWNQCSQRGEYEIWRSLYHRIDYDFSEFNYNRSLSYGPTCIFIHRLNNCISNWHVHNKIAT